MMDRVVRVKMLLWERLAMVEAEKVEKEKVEKEKMGLSSKAAII